MRYLLFLFAVVSLSALYMPARSTAADSPLDRLKNVDASVIKAHTLRCLPEKGFSMELSNGKIGIEKMDRFGATEQEAVLTFDNIDLNSGRARLIGNNGTSNLSVFSGDYGLNFVDRTLVGNMITYTVFTEKKGNDNKFVFVTSRHVSLSGEALPSQYYGFCKILD